MNTPDACVQDYYERIKTMPVFNQFPEKSLRGMLCVVGLVSLVEFAENEVVFSERSQDSKVYWILSGSVGIVRDQELITFLSRPGEYFGEMGIIDEAPRSASVLAVNRTLTLCFDMAVLNTLPPDQKADYWTWFCRGFARDLTGRLRRTTGELVEAQKDLKACQLKNMELRDQLKAVGK